MRMIVARAGDSRRNDHANLSVLCKTMFSLIPKMKIVKVIIFLLDKSNVVYFEQIFFHTLRLRYRQESGGRLSPMPIHIPEFYL